jgi:hypothetical protein
MTSPRHLIDKILVPHTAFMGAQQRLAQCFAYAKGGAHEPVCLAIVGESRTGKSRCVDAFRRKYPAARLDDGMHCPVLHVVVPSKPTVKSLAELILRSLGAVDWERGTETAKTIRLVELMKQCGVVALVLDEFHHFYDKSSHRVQFLVSDWLKNLMGATNVALFVLGLPSLQFVIDQNEQLAGRFSAPIVMPRFDWLVDDHRSEWLAILAAFTDSIRAEFDMPDLADDGLALRMYCATGGLMGYLTTTLRQAVWNAVDANARSISLEDLRSAHASAIWAKESLAHLPSPFDANLQVYPTPELISRTKLIGTAKPATHVRGRKVSVAEGALAASHVLAS